MREISFYKMANWRTIEWGVVGILVLALVASSGGIGGGTVDGQPSAEVGDGSATAAVESLPAERLRIDDGRFGTGVVYLRVPDVRVSVDDVQERPRLVYRIRIPELDVDDAATRSLAGSEGRTVTVRGVDRAFDPQQVGADQYEAIVTVRIQSFEVDETIVSVNETVEVAR